MLPMVYLAREYVGSHSRSDAHIKYTHQIDDYHSVLLLRARLRPSMVRTCNALGRDTHAQGVYITWYDGDDQGTRRNTLLWYGVTDLMKLLLPVQRRVDVERLARD
jgi:hypothetical protein